MNLIQIFDTDGEEFGLFTHEQDRDLQPLVDLCESRAREKADKLEEYLIDDFLEELQKEGFNRIFVVQELYTKIY